MRPTMVIIITVYLINSEKIFKKIVFLETEEFMENLAELAENAADYADDVQEYPPPVSAPAAPQTTKATSAHYPPHKLRSCEKKTDLYILQPDRLNTSGENNPLKGKLTNCHVTGCERYYRGKGYY